MAGTPAPTSLYHDLLQRVCDITGQTRWTNSGGATETVKNAVPRRFAPIGGSFPLIMVYVSGARYVKASKYEDHFISVTIQVWGGPVSAGYSGEMEDRLNYLYMALPAQFENRPYLNDIHDGSQFDYMMPDDAAEITENTLGTDGFEVNDGQTVMRYFGTEFILSVHLRIPRSRLS